MLYITSNGCIDIFIGAFRCGKSRSFIIMDAAHAHGTAVADIFVNPLNAQDSLKFAVRYEGGMQKKAAVIKLLRFCKNKAKGIGT